MAHSGGAKLSAVDAILAEAADLIALEQIAKLNTAHLVDDDSADLPSALESRFRKLKSLPAAAPAQAPPPKTLARSATLPDLPKPILPAPQQPPPDPATVLQEQQPEHHAEAGHNKTNTTPQQVQDDDDEDLERLFGSGGRNRPTLRERNRARDDDDDGRSPSPQPRLACCFGFSPKKPPKRTTPAKVAKKKKLHGAGDGDVLGVDAGEWGDENRRMVTELKEQQRKLKEALEEQVKVSRETAKMARWVKQASARMTHTAAIDDMLSDFEDDEELRYCLFRIRV